MVARDLAGILELAQMSILEIHPWNASVDEIEYPDRVIFDLDPDPAVPWARVVEAAFELRRRLAAFDLDSVVKTTGGKGLHVVMPFSSASRVSWDDAFAFSQAVSERLARDQPKAYVATMSKAQAHREDLHRLLQESPRKHRDRGLFDARPPGRAGRRPAGVGRADARAESAQLHGRDRPRARGRAEGRPVGGDDRRQAAADGEGAARAAK